MVARQMTREERVAFYQPDGNVLPFHLIKELFDSVPYASQLSIFFQILHNTGCRIEEIPNMKRADMRDNFLYWSLGKGQNGWRKEFIPDDLINEIDEYRRTHRVREGYIFSASRGDFISRQFRKLRKTLGKEWNEEIEVFNHHIFRTGYRYQLKGFRKNFQTMLFRYYWDYYKDPQIALEMVSKRMKHSTNGITFKHYIENVKTLGKDIDLFLGKLPCEWISACGQEKLFQYFEDKTSFSVPA